MSYRFLFLSLCLLFLLVLSRSFVFPSPTKSRDTLIKISSDHLYMIFAFYPLRIGDGCRFWEYEINISSRLRQLYMHSRRPRKLESNSLTHDEGVSLRGAEKDVIPLSQCVCLLSSIKLRLTVETVNYVIIAGWEVTPANCVSLYGFPKIACRKFIDFLPAAGATESMERAVVEFNRRHRSSSSRITDRNVNL